MRIISVIKIKDGVVDEITSFGIFDEKLSQDVVDKAEKLFTDEAIKIGCDETDIEDVLSDGYYEHGNRYSNIMNLSVCLTWSEIQNIETNK